MSCSERLGGFAVLFPPCFRVDVIFGKDGEQIVVFLFFVERELERLFDLVEVEGAGVGGEAAIGGDLVVIELLGRDDEAGVAGGRSGAGGGDDLLGLAGDTEDSLGA